MKSKIKISQPQKDSAIYLSRDISPGSKAKLIDAVSISAYNNDRAYEGCARCVLAAINEHLRLTPEEGFNECIKASTALAAGVARMGETCGALLGGIMALGLEFGSEDMSLFQRYADTMQISRELFIKFQDRYGTVKCAEIQEKLLGRRYNFYKEEDRESWYREGGLEKCPGVCAEAAGLAAEIILNHRKKL
jgi:C_GCAxxG_C_C family probable redox protein